MLENEERGGDNLRNFFNMMIILLLVIILLVLTNPAEEQFIDWTMKEIKENSNSQLESLLGEMIGKPVLMMSTTRKDYLLFSVFILDHGKEKGVFVGFLKNIFFKIK